MNPFAYESTKDPAVALKAVGAMPGAMFLAGGTTVLDLWKLGALAPAKLVEISGLPFTEIRLAADAVRMGAMVRMSEAAAHKELAAGYPMLAESLLLAASPQIRNMATLGGNLLQRPRGFAWRNPDPNKNDPPSRTDAIFGASAKASAPHPSDFAVALLALDAKVNLLRASEATRSLALADFYRVPGDDPTRLTTMLPNELITGIEFAAKPWARRSCYVKIRDRSSYQFALVSVAAAVQLEGDTIKDVRLAAGGVGTKPWRLSSCEEELRGKPANEESFRAVAALAPEGAKTHPLNAYKTELLQRTVVRALLQASSLS